MNQSAIKVIVLVCLLVVCLPIVSAAGDSAGSSGTSTSQNVPDFSLCNSTTLNPYCPLGDGEHSQPDIIIPNREEYEIYSHNSGNCNCF